MIRRAHSVLRVLEREAAGGNELRVAEYLLHRNRFGEVAGFIDVAAALKGNVVAEELHGDAHQDGLDDFVAFGNADDFVNKILGEFAVLRGDADDFSFAGLDLLDVGEALFEDFAGGSKENAGAFLADEGDGAVFHFGGGVAFGVDVGNFLEFEGAFEGDGEHELATKEEAIFVMGVFFGNRLDLLVLFEDLAHLIGEGFEGFNDFSAVGEAEVAEAAEVEGDHCAEHDL